MDQRESLAILLDEVLAGIVSAEDANRRIEQSTDYDEIWDGPGDPDYLFDALLQVALAQERGARGVVTGEPGRQLGAAVTRLRADAAAVRQARLHEASIPSWRRFVKKRRSAIAATLGGMVLIAATLTAWFYVAPRVDLTDDQETHLVIGGIVAAVAIAAIYSLDHHRRFGK